MKAYSTFQPTLTILAFFILFSFFGPKCLLAQDYQTGVAASTVEAKESNLSLADYLRRIPGLQVIGAGDNVTVRIRGGGSPTGNNEPLFIIDRVRIGNSYNQAKNQVDVNDIRYVQVLKDVASTNLYGMTGSNGVVVIHLKKKEKPKKQRKRKARNA